MQLPQQPTQRFPFQIDRQVGIGSMGVVYRARDVALDRLVAIKTLRRSLLEEQEPAVRDEMRKRFQQEARAAGRLSHPGITTVYGVGEEAQTPYLVMEWLDGRSFDEVLRSEPQLPPTEAMRIAIELLDALASAHKSGVVHRDIKPSNLMVLHDGRVKVTDFGIARIADEELVKTQAGVVLATPKFAAPEQLRGEAVDARVDIWATGVLLYQMLSGELPFEGSTFMELANSVFTHEPTAVGAKVAHLPPALGAIVHTALSKERQDRYESAEHMAGDLRRVLAAEAGPTEVEPSSIDHLATTRDAAGPIVPTLQGLPRKPPLAMVRFAESWPARQLDDQPIDRLLDRLLDVPLHAAAFAGAVVVDDVWLFFADGVLLGAVDAATGVTGGAAESRLPTSGRPTLHPMPEALPPATMAVLTSILHPPRIVHDNLDSSFINLPALAKKLREETFSGVFQLRHGDDLGMVFFVDGHAVVHLYSEGWEGLPVERSWHHWISERTILARVLGRTMQPTPRWYRRVFGSARFDARPIEGDAAERSDVDTTTSILSPLLSTGSRSRQLAAAVPMAVRPSQGAAAARGIDLERAPAARLLRWMLTDLANYLGERGLSASWKYLAEWLTDVRHAQVYHPLQIGRAHV